MANNYIKLGSETLIDLRDDTVTADKLLLGYTAHDKSGASISGSLTPVQFGYFDTGSSKPTSYTIMGLTGTPTNIMIIKPGWQGKNNSNICALNRFVVVPGGTVDRYHYAVCGYNPSPTSGAGDYTWIADTGIGNCVSWNRSAGSVKITLPKLRLGDTGSLNTQSFFRQTYCWVIW